MPLMLLTPSASSVTAGPKKERSVLVMSTVTRKP
jgi:hypothetical protein